MKNGVYYSKRYDKIYLWHKPFLIYDNRSTRRSLWFWEPPFKKLDFIWVGDL